LAVKITPERQRKLRVPLPEAWPRGCLLLADRHRFDRVSA
jgi:hypothetical protein